jgi:glycosyltransferase involved in cell wall biosynthesis
MSDKKPLVSVVMPVFNVENYIEDSIKSILNQTFTDFEFIIIDDGSTDKSQDIINIWSEKDHRIKVFTQSNKGRPYTRNRGLELATADLIAIMDSDDTSLPQRLELQYNYMNTHTDVVALGGQVDAICMKGLDLYTTSFPLSHKEIESALLNDDGAQFCQPCTMIRKGVAIDVGGYDESYRVGEDTDLFLRMALKGKLANLPNILLKYRKHLGSATGSQNRNDYLQSMPRIQKAWEDRGMEFPKGFKHWSELAVHRTEQDDLLQWGWNALTKNQIGIARYYAKKLLFLGQYDMNLLRFLVCTLRGR